MIPGGGDGPLPTSPRTGCAGEAGARSEQISESMATRWIDVVVN
jgi:hypothetical protein